MNTVEFDIRGQVCPSTLLTALREINKHSEQLKKGTARLSFKTDNRDSVSTIPESAKNMGYAAHVIKTKGYYCIEIGRGQ